MLTLPQRKQLPHGAAELLANCQLPLEAAWLPRFHFPNGGSVVGMQHALAGRVLESW